MDPLPSLTLAGDDTRRVMAALDLAIYVFERGL
jgi:hypothetical protein